MKIGITGSLNYENEYKIKELLYNLKNQYKDELLIITRANQFGTDKIVKKICKRIFGIKYTEFPPYFCKYNEDCLLNETNQYKYNKKYSLKYIPIRDNIFINFCDIIILFLNEDEKNINNLLIDKIKKKGKKIIVTY